MFEVLWSVAGLDVTAPRFAGFDLDDVGPQSGILAQRIDHDAIALGSLGMIGAGVVLFENRMMDYGCRHLLCSLKKLPGKRERGHVSQPRPRISLKLRPTL